jgi:serine/threonine protein kinase
MDKYTIIKILGKGSFGETSKATNREDGKMYAIKKYLRRSGMTAHQQYKYNQSLLHEIKAMTLITSICHDHTACFKESFTDNGNFYIVMDLINGWDLASKIFEPNRIYLTTRQISFPSILGDLIIGLQKMHALGLVHQDIKSENIMFDMDTNHFKFVDFGLSCILDEGATTPTERAYSTFFKSYPCAVPGNALCLSPEMIDLKSAKPRQGETYPETWIKAHDIWSVGCVLFTWFTFSDNETYDDSEMDLYLGYQFSLASINYDPTFLYLKTHFPDVYNALMIMFQRDPYVRNKIFNEININNPIPIIDPNWNNNTITVQAIKNQRIWKESIQLYDQMAYKEGLAYQQSEIDKLKTSSVQPTSAQPSSTQPSVQPISSARPRNLPIKKLSPFFSLTNKRVSFKD